MVSVVVPVLDPGPALLDCLASLQANDGPVEVIVSDSGSSDGFVEKAVSAHPKVRLLRGLENNGFAWARNVAAGAAKGSYLLFLDSDVMLPAGGIDQLLAMAKADTETAIWQAVVVSPEGDVEDAGELFTWSGFFVRRHDVPDADVESYPVFACSAQCLLIRRDTFSGLNGFRDRYFTYMEDTDLCWRARIMGWEARVVPSVRVHHTANETRSLPISAVRYLTFRNRLCMILANSEVGTLLRILPIHILASLAFAVRLIFARQPRSALAVAVATLWPVAHIAELAEQRRVVLKLRARSDRDVISRELIARDGQGCRSLRMRSASRRAT